MSHFMYSYLSKRNYLPVSIFLTKSFKSNCLRYWYLKCCIPFSVYRKYTSSTNTGLKEDKTIELDYNDICNEGNIAAMKNNITRRKSGGDIDKVIALWKALQLSQTNSEQRTSLKKALQKEALRIPNKASPHLTAYEDKPFLIKTCNDMPQFSFKPFQFLDLAKRLHLAKIDPVLSQMVGPRTYNLNGALADLERAIFRYTISFLIKKGFTLLSVPDLLNGNIIERCGMQIKGEISQVFHLENLEGVCLSGTSEMALGGYLQDKTYDFDQLPLKFAALSRCYRDEMGNTTNERGLYRVSQFNKVEMFGVTANESGEESGKLYQEFVDIQTELYTQLGIHFQVLDMPISDLGDPAYTKTDIEAWIPVQKIYGEISSATNCLDYQSRRLKLRYKDSSRQFKFPHTVNGTACATPRLLISLVATHQQANSEILIPEALRPFMNGLEAISKKEKVLGYTINHFKPKSYPGTILRPEEIEGES